MPFHMQPVIVRPALTGHYKDISTSVAGICLKNSPVSWASLSNLLPIFSLFLSVSPLGDRSIFIRLCESSLIPNFVTASEIYFYDYLALHHLVFRVFRSGWPFPQMNFLPELIIPFFLLFLARSCPSFGLHSRSLDLRKSCTNAGN